MATRKQMNFLLSFLPTAFYTWTAATSLHLIKIDKDESKDKLDVVGAGLFGLIGAGVLASLIYQTEVEVYGFSPSFPRK